MKGSGYLYEEMRHEFRWFVGERLLALKWRSWFVEKEKERWWSMN